MSGTCYVLRLLTWIALAWIVGCAGEAVPRVDGQPALAETVEGDASPVFAPQPDADLPAQVPTGPDAAVSYKDCSKWSSWTCQEIPVMLCKATCVTPTKTYSVSCLKKGGCVCGLSTGLCGPYSYNQPCDACRQAFENGCCEKQ